MELRRALLLFAVVLGLAAIVTSFSRPAERDDKASDSGRAQPGATASDPRRTEREPAHISFSSGAQLRKQRLPANRAAAITVQVARAGQVELSGLGLTAVAEPLTPARFDVLESRAGRYEVLFTPASTNEARTVGILQIVR